MKLAVPVMPLFTLVKVSGISKLVQLAVRALGAHRSADVRLGDFVKERRTCEAKSIGETLALVRRFRRLTGGQLWFC